MVGAAAAGSSNRQQRLQHVKPCMSPCCSHAACRRGCRCVALPGAAGTRLLHYPFHTSH
jgi:hypothetical protein